QINAKYSMNQTSSLCPVCGNASRYDYSGRDLMFNHYDRYDYHQCSTCELIFQHPLPSMEIISNFYPDSYDVYEESRRLKKITRFRMSRLKLKFGYKHLQTSTFTDFFSLITTSFQSGFEVPFIENGQLLDVGCGNGRYLDGMNKLGWNAKGVEFNESAVKVCRLSGLDVHHGDLFSANFKDNSFDVINVSHVVEHVPNPRAFFSELSRILKQNGQLIIKTPNSKALGRLFFNTNWYANDVPRHIYLFSEKNLSELAQRSDLKINQFRTHSTPKIILNSLGYITHNKGTPSKRIWWKRVFARLYVWLSHYKSQGDEIFAVFTKN
ncbi:class I SAM-dependent methyltransferase, partial [Methylicorpusculum sp.]|uniref:class I SAM-dependent methyltransferase n=1 Tax=Methylicorpusculum sp. TaxID=2713644 RepID=UPI002ABC8B7B